MEQLLTLIEGTEVECTDGSVGRLSRALVDIERKTIAHLAVARKDYGDVRLVPFDRVQSAGRHLVLDCTSGDFDDFASAEKLEWVPSPLAAAGGSQQDHIIKRHTVPEGEAEIYDDEDVRAKTGKVGHLRGLVVDTNDGRIEKLVVTVGHIFSKHDISIPAALIMDFDIEEVRLSASKSQIRDDNVMNSS